jgi:phosphoglycerate dehydrogenase-like enzyme
MNRPINILVAHYFPEDLIAPLRNISPRLEITVQPARKPGDISAEIWAQSEVLYTSGVLPELAQVPKLEWIQFHFAGVDAVAGASILQKPGLIATTLSGAHVPQMGEYVLMMLLALGHRLPKLVEHQLRSEWPKDRWERFLPTELRGSTVGIVGYGSIGRQVARLCQTFGATVLATKRNAMQPKDTGYIQENLGDPGGDFVHRLYPTQALKSMLKECDFIVVTTPLTEETRGLIGAEAFAVMKPTACIVDVSRGGVIDHKALISALREKKIARASLDVFPEEPLPDKSPLWKMPNVLITPHISGISPHYDCRALRLFGDNLRNYLDGKTLFNQFKPERGY